MARDRESVERWLRTRDQIRRQREIKPRRPWYELGVPAVLVAVVLTGGFELGRFYYVRSSVHQQFKEAARFVSEVGSPGASPTGQQVTRAESVTQFIASEVKSLPVTLETVVLKPADGGKPGDILRIEARYRLVASPLMRLLISRDDQFFTESAVVTNQSSF